MKPIARLFKAAALIAGLSLSACASMAPPSLAGSPEDTQSSKDGLQQVCADLNGATRIVYKTTAGGPFGDGLYSATLSDVNPYSTASRNVQVTGKFSGLRFHATETKSRYDLFPGTIGNIQAETNGLIPTPPAMLMAAAARVVAQRAIKDVGERNLKGACLPALLTSFYGLN